MPTGKPPPSPLAVLSVVALLLAAVSGQSSSLECREDTRVTRAPNGDLMYGSLPPTDAPDTEDYNPQGLGGWYDLARGFVNTVQPQNLPYGESPHHLSVGAVFGWLFCKAL